MRPGVIALCFAASACAGSPMKTKGADGLAFACDGGAPMTIIFNDHGYLPDSSALDRDRDSAQSQRQRSLATLTYAGTSHAMTAEWAEFGLGYVAATAGSDGRRLILSLRGETATLGWRGDEAGAPVEPLTTCRRVGREPASATPDAAHGTDDTHRP